MRQIRDKRRRAVQAHKLALCPEFLTRSQAASVAGVTTRTVDRWLRDPSVPLTPHRTGAHARTVLVSRAELGVLLEITPVGASV